MNAGYNPEFNPTGIEGGIDTNALPWIDLTQAPGMAIKPLRASVETGIFTVVVKLNRGTELARTRLSGCDGHDGPIRHTRPIPEGPMAGRPRARNLGLCPRQFPDRSPRRRRRRRISGQLLRTRRLSGATDGKSHRRGPDQSGHHLQPQPASAVSRWCPIHWPNA